MVVARSTLGKDESGLYNIYEYDFKPKNYSETILLSSGMHTYELSAHFGCANFINNIMNRNNNHKGYKYIRENVRIKVIPIVNPWGWNQSPKKYGNVNGVNINRNFDYNNKWDAFPVHSANPSDSNYNEWNVKGSEPFSEAETKILRNWGMKNKNAKFWIDCHTGLDVGPYDNMVYYLSDCVLRSKVETALAKLENRIREKYSKQDTVSYVAIDSAGSIRQQFSNNVLGIPTITLEQTPNNKLWGTNLNNEGGDIENYEVCLATYIMEFLKSDTSMYSLHDYIKYLDRRIKELESINGTIENPPSENPPSENPPSENPPSNDNNDSGLIEGLVASVDLSNGNIIDSSGNGNNATLTGAYVAESDGIALNGADGMIDTGVQLLANDSDTEFTLKYVANAISNTNPIAQYFFSQGVTSSEFLFGHMTFYGGKDLLHSVKLGSQGKILFDSGDNDTSINKFKIDYNTKNVFHITYKKTGNSAVYKVYVNGVLKSKDTVDAVKHLNSNLVLGNNTNLNRGFIGKLYEYKIYNKCLSDSEIKKDQ